VSEDGRGRACRVEPTLHPTAFVAPSAEVLGDVTVGEDASVWYQCVLRGDIAPITIGPRSNVQDLTLIHVDPDLPTIVGSDVGIGHRAIIHGCTIGDGCLIGMGAVLLSGVTIGEGSVVGAGSVVPEGVLIPAGQLVIGVPARVVRPVDENLRARLRDTVDSYVRLKERHRRGEFRHAGEP